MHPKISFPHGSVPIKHRGEGVLDRKFTCPPTTATAAHGAVACSGAGPAPCHLRDVGHSTRLCTGRSSRRHRCERPAAARGLPLLPLPAHPPESRGALRDSARRGGQIDGGAPAAVTKLPSRAKATRTRPGRHRDTKLPRPDTARSASRRRRGSSGGG